MPVQKVDPAHIAMFDHDPRLLNHGVVAVIEGDGVHHSCGNAASRISRA